MNFNIRGGNLTVTTSLREYIERKISKLERYFDSQIDSEAYVNLHVHDNEQVVEVTVPMQELLLRAEETHSDMYAAIDLVIEKLERQIRKFKTKVNRRTRRVSGVKHMSQSIIGLQDNTVTYTDSDAEESAFEIVRTKRFNLKPMDAEEAILQMDMLGHSFFVFSDSETGLTNVVYKRKDGKYGLIEPEN